MLLLPMPLLPPLSSPRLSLPPSPCLPAATVSQNCCTWQSSLLTALGPQCPSFNPAADVRPYAQIMVSNFTGLTEAMQAAMCENPCWPSAIGMLQSMAHQAGPGCAFLRIMMINIASVCLQSPPGVYCNLVQMVGPGFNASSPASLHSLCVNPCFAEIDQLYAPAARLSKQMVLSNSYTGGAVTAAIELQEDTIIANTEPLGAINPVMYCSTDPASGGYCASMLVQQLPSFTAAVSASNGNVTGMASTIQSLVCSYCGRVQQFGANRVMDSVSRQFPNLSARALSLFCLPTVTAGLGSCGDYAQSLMATASLPGGLLSTCASSFAPGASSCSQPCSAALGQLLQTVGCCAGDVFAAVAEAALQSGSSSSSSIAPMPQLLQLVDQCGVELPSSCAPVNSVSASINLHLSNLNPAVVANNQSLFDSLAYALQLDLASYTYSSPSSFTVLGLAPYSSGPGTIAQVSFVSSTGQTLMTAASFFTTSSGAQAGRIMPLYRMLAAVQASGAPNALINPSLLSSQRLGVDSFYSQEYPGSGPGIPGGGNGASSAGVAAAAAAVAALLAVAVGGARRGE